MAATSHLKSLQALDMAIRTGSLKAAAETLGITPAAVGQRIRSLELFLGVDLLLRGRSGLRPTAELDRALPDLRAGFAALERVTETLDFQRTAEIHVVADGDWYLLWLMPRLPAFQAEHPNILFNINGTGDVKLRIGAPDLRVTLGGPGEPLYRDVLLPVVGPDNVRRLADWDPVRVMEGMPLLHLDAHRQSPASPGFVDWFARYGHRREGPDRGVYYKHTRTALDAVRENVGFLVCGLSLVLPMLDSGEIVLPFPPGDVLPSPEPYRMTVREAAANRPQMHRFLDWLRAESRATQARIEQITQGPPAGRTLPTF